MRTGTPRWRTAGNNTRIGATSTVFALFLCATHALTAPAPSPPIPRPEVSGQLAALRLAEQQARGERDLARVESQFAALLEGTPHDPQLRAAYGEFLARQGRVHDAAREMGDAARDAPGDAQLAHRSGNLHFAAGDVRSAAAAFERATELAPQAAAYRYDLANLYYLFRRDLAGMVAPTADDVLRVALRRFGEATEIEPENPEYWRAYAEVFYILPGADWIEARRAWLQFLDLTADKEFARLHLMRVAIRRGDRKEALGWGDSLPAGSRLGIKLRQQAEALPEGG